MFSPAISLQNRSRRAARPNSILKSIPAPIGGWNARDAMSEMKSDEAIYLDNFVPDTLGVRKRRGVTTHATGITGNFVESLLEYNAPGSSAKLFAASPTTIWDVTAEATATAVVTSLSNGRWQSTMFPTPGGNFLVICNGTDAVRNYNGTAWSTPTINNVSSSSLINVTAHMSRLWFIEQSTLSVWYLDTNSISGDATELDLGSISDKGGELIAMASWSRDGGSGLDDFAVFVTSKGQVHVFQGSDPDSALTWARVGTFNGPEPIGRRCLIKLGADLCLLSSQGVLPLPQYLSESSAGVSKLAVTDKISGAFKDAYLNGGTDFGWAVKEYPRENLLIVNVPITERAVQHQYVMNLKTGAWCRFKDINAGCIGLKGDELFFGCNDGIVRKYGGGTTFDDDGDPVQSLGVQAYNNFGTPSQKHFLMARPLMTGPLGYVPQVKLLTDFNTSLPTFDPVAYSGVGPAWDETFWDLSEWGDGLTVTAQWQTISGAGTVGALAIATTVTTALIWNQTDVLMERGGVL
jgi:hypothetical protein